MKTKYLTIVVSAFIGVVVSALTFGAESAKNDVSARTASRVEVKFDHPEKFKDVKDSVIPTEKGRDAILAQLSTFIQMRARRVLPAGKTLEITFTNIDLAGEYESWRMTPGDKVRMFTDNTPPRFYFTYRIVDDATGRVERSGKEYLTDLNYLSHMAGVIRPDPLLADKEVLGDWMDSDLKRETEKR